MIRKYRITAFSLLFLNQKYDNILLGKLTQMILHKEFFMLSENEMLQLVGSLIWLLAGVGVFIVGMNFMSDALEKSAGNSMKRLLERISNNRFSGVGIGAGVTAIIQSSSATSVMVIGLVNAGVMTLMQATPIIMGANIGTTITGVLVALKNDYFNMLMYLLAFAGVILAPIGFVWLLKRAGIIK
jgi:Na+/phosphate symporter